MQVQGARPPIVVRRPALEIGPDLPVHWAESPFATHVLDALSSIFPEGEAFFVRSVRRFADRVDDPGLRRAVQAFSAQEALHRAAHERHVALLIERYPAIAVRNRIEGRMLRYSEARWPRLALATTAGLEHLTALLARRILSDPERWTDAMDPRMAPLWQWHALEEAEHKAVAFDVLQIVAPSRVMRAYALATNTIALVLATLDRAIYMLWKDGLLWRLQTWRDGWRFLLGGRGAGPRGGPGLLRGMGRDYWSWYRHGFHPDQADDRALIARWQRHFADLAAPGT